MFSHSMHKHAVSLNGRYSFLATDAFIGHNTRGKLCVTFVSGTKQVAIVHVSSLEEAREVVSSYTRVHNRL